MDVINAMETRELQNVAYQMLPLLSRRNALTAFATLLLNSSVVADDTEMSEVVPTYGETSIDLKNFERYWPKGKTVPKIIGDVAALISPWPRGIVSQFYIVASRPNDYFIENGADLWRQFGMFVGFANGTEYALWYYEGCPAGAEPVVSFGDEGDLRILAPNLKAFFSAWGEGRGVGWFDPFDYEATPELLEKRKAYGAQIMALVNQMPTPPVVPDVPDFEKYIKTFAEKAAARNDADPTLLAIKALLSNYIPKEGTSPRGKSWKLRVVDGKVEVETSLMEPDFTQLEPLPEREALIPLVTKARLEREVAQNDGRGPWTSGVLYILESGHTFISGDWN
jgi:hypothetical protein